MSNPATFGTDRDKYQPYYTVINKKNYLFKATFANADGYNVSFEKDAVLELMINDSVYTPFKTGYIVINNTQDVIERYVNSPVNREFTPALASTPNQTGYQTRGDTRDLLFLTIVPIEAGAQPYEQQSLAYNKFFGFNYVFSVTNEEDIETNDGKAKKYTIEDLDYVILKHKKLFFSSTQLLKATDTPYLNNYDRRAFTGDSLKYILQNGLESPGAVYGTLSGSTVITPYFEQGVSKLFYSSPNDYTAYDDLMYVYKFHVSQSSGTDFSCLLKDYFTGEYTLESASSVFNKAYDKRTDSGSSYFIENLTIAGTQSPQANVLQNKLKKPLQALEFGESGDVISAKFFNTPGDELQDKIKTILVHKYDFELNLFTIDSINGDIQNVKTDFSNLYVNPMKGDNNAPIPHLILNNTQKTNLNYENRFLEYSEGDKNLRLAVGRNELLKRILKLNLGVELIVQGGFQRKSGRFLSVDRTGTYIDNQFDDKFLGIYFIIHVDHQFVNNNVFLNKILAVKTYHFTDPKYNENTP